MEAMKYQMRTPTYMKRINVFWQLKWGIQPFQCIQEKTPSSTEWLLNPENKGKYKRNVFVSYLLISFLLYNFFGNFFVYHAHDTNIVETYIECS